MLTQPRPVEPVCCSDPHHVKSAMACLVIICGPAGIRKGLLILVNQTNWRSPGLWCTNMVKGKLSPFAGLVGLSASFDYGMYDD